MATMIAKGCSEGNLEFYMCLVKRTLSILVTEQNALGLNQWSEQNVKLNDAEHKLKDQGRQLKKMSLGQALVMMRMIT
ncbi:uncharacterized protein LOC110270553 isoform X2 [Arachis ipaensis]|uniref:uncharacterized protein LOC110270553 isoform X2 n=1 Tax=Arachis ipaensis TaxID=130454 RepID=UPI000A2B002C|nr:uncharacterized protein LOC110270553 isoform X2 [Arachis ipaensis]